MTLFNLKNKSLYDRLVLTISLLFVSAYFASLIISQNIYIHFVKKEYHDHILALARNISSVSYYPMINDNEVELYKIGSTFLEEEDFDFIALINRKKQVVFGDSKKTGQMATFTNDLIRDHEHDFGTKPVIHQESPEKKVVIYPVKMGARETPWGYILLGFNDAGINYSMKSAKYTSLLISTLLLFLGLVLLQRFSRRITKPVHDIMDGTEQVIKGNFHHQIHVDDEGELGQLARKFNEMVLKLNYYYKQKSLLNKKLHEYNERLEERIRERTAQLNKIQKEVVSIFHQIPVGLLVVDIQGGILWYNNELLKIIELDDADLMVNENLFSLQHFKDIGLFEVLSQLFNKDGKQVVQHHLDIKKDPNARLVEIASQPLLSDGEIKDGMIYIIRDVTREVILEKKLIQDQKLENIGEIAGGIAHDFNNILAIIMPNAQLLKLKVQDNQEWLKYLDTIERAADQGASLTKKILSFSRGSSRENFEILNINNVVSDFAKMFRRVLDRKIEIVQELDKKLWNVKAEKGQLEQILMNLSVNARDAMQQGGKLIFRTKNITIRSSEKMEYDPKLEPGKYVRLSVEDNGSGIPHKYLDKIFDPFFSSKKEGKGTGLGLSVVYGIVKGHKGVIDVESQLGKGSQFFIYFPISEERAETIPIPVEKVEPGTGTLLIVDDEMMIQETLTGMLQSLNYKVLSADNGKKAVDLFKSQKDKIDAILMDIQMPEMDGVEAAKHILKVDPKAKIIFTSGYAEPKSFDNLRKMGYRLFLKKPYKIGNLADIIQQALN